MDQTQQQNGKSRFSIPTLGCEGCEDRKQIMGAGNWKIDIAILLLLIAGGFVLFKVRIT